MGHIMKNGIMTHSLSHEFYVLQVNGRVRTIYRRYEDALRAGLLLKYQFPNDDVKVCETHSEEANQDTVWH